MVGLISNAVNESCAHSQQVNICSCVLHWRELKSKMTSSGQPTRSNMNNAMNDNDACLQRPSIVESNTNNLNSADFIIPAVMEYLGIRSLVNFGSVCKTHRKLLSNEVERRKAYIATIEKEVLRLMRRNVPSLSSTSGDDDYEIHTRATIKEARTLSNQALQLIDDEINYLSTSIDSQSTWEEYVLIYGSHDFFINERKKFFHSHSTVGSFYILPDAFYFPPVGEAKQSSEARILTMFSFRRLNLGSMLLNLLLM